MSGDSPACCGGCCVSPSWRYEPTVMGFYNNSPQSNIVLPIVTGSVLTNEEKAVLNHLVQAWNSFITLPNSSTDNLNEYRDAIHRCQQLIALRVARRADPDVWKQPE